MRHIVTFKVEGMTAVIVDDDEIEDYTNKDEHLEAIKERAEYIYPNAELSILNHEIISIMEVEK